MSSKDVIVEKITIGGIRRPTISFRGSKKRSINIEALVDGKKYKFVQDAELGRNFALNLNNSKDDELERVVLNINIPKTSKHIKIYTITTKGKKELIKSIDTTLMKRIFSKIIFEIGMLPTRFRRFCQVLEKIFVTLKKHKFIISPKLFKRYFKSAKNNLGKNNINDKFYDPLNQDDYLKWLSSYFLTLFQSV